MRSVPLKAFQAEVGESVHQVESGETILILRQDRVVAELNPPQRQSGVESRDVFFADAAKRGWITPARIVSDEPPPRMPVAPLRDLLPELDEDRADA